MTKVELDNSTDNRNGVVPLHDDYKSVGLWEDAWKRLLRNRAATLGLIIIVIFILLAIFAPIVAPRHYATQNLEMANAAPQWVIDLFPTLSTADADFTITATEVNLYTAPHELGEVITPIARGDEIVIEARAATGNWWLLAHTAYGVRGWIESRFVLLSDSDTLESLPVVDIDTDLADLTLSESDIRGTITDFADYYVEMGQEVTSGDLLAEVNPVAKPFVSIADGIVMIEVKKGDNVVSIIQLPEGTTEIPDRWADLVVQEVRIRSRDFPNIEFQVESEQEVSAGTLLALAQVQEAQQFNTTMKGTVIIDGSNVVVTQEDVKEFDISAGWDILVENGQEVAPDKVLARNFDTSDTIVAELADVKSESLCYDDNTLRVRCLGTVYLTEDKLFVHSPNLSYVIVDNSYALGADQTGRDLFSRIIYGSRVSLAVAFIGPFVSLMIGLSFGLVSGYFGGRVDNIMMRFVDIMYAFPTLLLIILLMAFFRAAFSGGEAALILSAQIDESATVLPVTVGVDVNLDSEFRSGWTIIIDEEAMRVTGFEEDGITVERGVDDTILAAHAANTRISVNRPKTIAYWLFKLDTALGGMLFISVGIGITAWMGMARLTRGQALSVKEKDYVEAARSLGASTPKIMSRHVLPNILGPIIVAETLMIPAYISYEAFLSFIGLGVNAPTASWGSMIADGAQTLRDYPHQTVFPALALFLIMFAFNFLGDGLRDALDPRMRGVD
jgi:ABC-type dipeptide/oligopeptide/nickel transport system permease subunit